MHDRLHRLLTWLAFTMLLALAGCGGTGSFTSPNAKPPVAAIILSDYVTNPGYPIIFSGLGSSDPQGQILTYAWNFGDNSTSTDVRVLKGYAAVGTYAVTLKVTNQSNLSTTASTSVRIVLPGQVPTANAGGPYSGNSGTPILFNGTASTDPQGLPLTYAWTFGDGGTATGVTPTHTYTAFGPFQVSLTVTNTAGLSASATSTVSIAYPNPTVTLNGPYAGKPTLAIAFKGTATDPYDASFTYQWNFGDGAYAQVASPTHAYAAVGTYPVSLTVTGQYKETTTVTSTATITAQGAAPGFGGLVQSGMTPIVGAHVHLLAAASTGYGQPSLSLLSGTGFTDFAGPYLPTSATGAFSIPANLPCTTQEQIYVYATGGTIGANTNPAVGLLAALGPCGALTPATSVTVDEGTTVAAAYALAGYATGPAAVSSPATTAAQTGVGNAFLNAANLVSTTTGKALGTTPASGGTSPQSTVDTLANILNACVNSASGSSACTSLLALTQSTDTASAALAIAHAQGANVAALYALQTPSSPFTPVLTTAPHDFALAVTYSGLSGVGTSGLAIDGLGNVWVFQYPTVYGNSPYLTQLASNGAVQQAFATTCNALNVADPNAIAIDAKNNVFLLTTSGGTYYDSYGNEQSYSTAQLCTVSAAGVMLSPPGGYSLGGSQLSSVSLYDLAIDKAGTAYIPSTTLLGRTVTGSATNGLGYLVGNAPFALADAIDAAGNFWVSSPQTNGIVKLSASGALLSPANGFTGGGLSVPASVAIDNSGNVWAINTQTNYPNAGQSISKLSPAGVPLSGTGFTAGPQVPFSLAIDGSSNVWVITGGAPALSVYELAPTGAPTLAIQHTTNLREYLDDPQSIALDSTGSVWISNGLDPTITQFIGAATPVVTPVAANLLPPYGSPASKP